MARVLITQPVYAEATAELRAQGHEVVERNGPPMSAEGLAEAAAGFHAVLTVLTDQVSEGVFAANPQLSVVANIAAGVDNIDRAAAAAHGVTVTNTPDSLTDATADLTMALLLAVARRVPEGDRQVRDGRFSGWTLQQEPMGTDVTGARLGIIGFGKIGRAVARRAQHGFGMSIATLARDGREPQAQGLEVSTVGLDELLADCDVISLHCPLTTETRHLIDAHALARMPAHALLLNTGRGPLVDERALAEALRDGIIAGAGLDVYEHEPDVDPLLLQQRERVVLLPHVGSATERTRRDICAVAARNAAEALAGKTPPDLVAAG
ncbi:MAG: D-glycerate dehydrogenase [Actinobacteria bacterium QS_8_72_14]|nr:MAG: D-glycerate dehydrogenase [Actinobacteria bacterium QS_8_72_14]